MEGQRFDTLARVLANGMPRRAALRAFGAGAAAAVLTRWGTARSAARARTCRDFCSFFEALAPGECQSECARCEGRGREFCGVGFHDRPFCCLSGEACLQQKQCCPRHRVCLYGGSIVDCCAPGYTCLVDEAGEGTCGLA